MSALLDFVTFQELSNWSVAHLLQNHFNYNQSYPLVKIGSFLKRNKTAIDVEDDTIYKRVTIKLYNGGVFLRDMEIGKNIGTKKQFVIKKGQFLLSKIDARNGAFGVVTEEVDDAIITGNFWTFDVDYSKINPYFLTLLTTTQKFMTFSQSASNGTTGRHYLQEERFLNTKIPLPSLEDQQRIVNNYQTKILEAEEQKAEAKTLETGIKTYLINELGINNYQETITALSDDVFTIIKYSSLTKWGLSYLTKEQKNIFDSCNYKLYPLKSLIKKFDGGKTPSKANEKYWNGTISWTSPKDFSGYEINDSIDYITNLAVEESGIKVFPKGTILVVFRSGILQHSIPIAITNIETAINQDLKAIQLDHTKINTKYFMYVIRNFQKEILELVAKKGATVESIEVSNFLDFKIPLPTLDIQDQIINHIEEMRFQINSLNESVLSNTINALLEFEAEIFNEA